MHGAIPPLFNISSRHGAYLSTDNFSPFLTNVPNFLEIKGSL
jgi:hypothetical protein